MIRVSHNGAFAAGRSSQEHTHDSMKVLERVDVQRLATRGVQNSPYWKALAQVGRQSQLSRTSMTRINAVQDLISEHPGREQSEGFRGTFLRTGAHTCLYNLYYKSHPGVK